MQLPFSKQEFFDQLAAYNGALWPAVVALWAVSVLACVWLLSSRRPHGRWISALLGVQWAWSAVAYHVAFFTRINPAAWLFAAIFLLQAALFFWSGVTKGRLSFTSPRPAWTPIGFLLGVSADYALPLAGAALAVFELQESELSSRAVPLVHSPVGR